MVRDELADGGRVSSRRQLTLQRRQPLDCHPELVREVLHRLLAGRERAGHDEHVVAAAALFGGELQHVQRRAADVQARDHVHDPQRPPLSHSTRRCGHGGGNSDGTTRDDAQGEPEDRRHRDAAEERRARERARERRRPGERQVGEPFVGPRARPGAPDPDRGSHRHDGESQEQRCADDPELVEHLVVGLLGDEAAGGDGK